VVRFNPQIFTNDAAEDPELVEDQEEKFLQRDIIEYLQKIKYQDNLWPSKGRMKNWNLVRQRLHENREVFFSGLPRVTTTNHFYQ